MKTNSLLEVYKLNRKILGIVMPIFVSMWLIAAIIVLIVLPEIWWLCLIFFGISIAVMILYLVIRRYINRKIDEKIDRNKR